MKRALNPLEKESLVKEAAARAGLLGRSVLSTKAAEDNEENFLKELHPKQLAFVQSKAKKKIAVCGRRAGKTTGLLFLTMRALRMYPNATIPYIALSKDQCRRNFWKPLQELNIRFRLGLKFDRQRLIATAPNGAEVVLIGAEAEDDIEKLRGDKFPLAMVDECASFKPHIAALVDDVLDNAMGDYDGTICLVGSPRASTGFFYECATGGRPDWEYHHWNVLDNSKFPRWSGKPDWMDLATVYVATKARQLGETSVAYIREVLGQFYTDTDAQYFKFKPERNTYTSLPDVDFMYIEGVDPGYNDCTAFVVLAVSLYTKSVYVVETFQKAKMLDTDIAAKQAELERKYPLIKRVCDFASKQFVVSMNNRYQLLYTAADKTDRLTQIEMLNADFTNGRVLISENEVEFCKELEQVIWNADRTGPRTSGLGHHADRFDALRYAWWAAQKYSGKLEGAGAESDSKAALSQPETFGEALEQSVVERIERERDEYAGY